MPAHSKSMEQQYWQAIEGRDRSFDGRFFYGVITTGVYCRPSCPARVPRRENVRFFASQEDAERAGLRACLRCKPNQDAAEPMRAICRYIEAHVDERLTLADLAQRAGVSRFHLQRSFKAAIGVSPREYQEGLRMARLKRELRETRG